jgi:two-component system chemotaxis response regulator CheB
VAGVILTGLLDDGTAGLAAIKQAGGIAIVQDPREAEEPSMPRSALRYVEIDYCVKVAEMPALLSELAITGVEAISGPEKIMPEDAEIEVGIAANERRRPSEVAKLGAPSVFTCPECHGTLLKIRDGKPPRFRCHYRTRLHHGCLGGFHVGDHRGVAMGRHQSAGRVCDGSNRPR